MCECVCMLHVCMCYVCMCVCVHVMYVCMHVLCMCICSMCVILVMGVHVCKYIVSALHVASTHYAFFGDLNFVKIVHEADEKDS